VLFVYDALMRGQERENFLSAEKTKFLGSATARGMLYAIGDFPGLVLDSHAHQHPASPSAPAAPASELLRLDASRVHGELFEILDPLTFFATLDVIEGYWPDQAERSLFVRQLITVEAANGETKAWAYILNLPVNGLPRFAPKSQ
jgi:gamma-glutamylcyclotransferase (GGCT)/AIG2-like uncharacterized protein YtfP